MGLGREFQHKSLSAKVVLRDFAPTGASRRARGGEVGAQVDDRHLSGPGKSVFPRPPRLVSPGPGFISMRDGSLSPPRATHTPALPRQTARQGPGRGPATRIRTPVGRCGTPKGPLSNTPAGVPLELDDPSSAVAWLRRSAAAATGMVWQRRSPPRRHTFPKT
jgi:hypothetical protein